MASQSLSRRLPGVDDDGGDQLLTEYDGRPKEFFKNILGLETWEKQNEIIESVHKNKETWVRACHGVGKTMIAAMMAEYWMTARGMPVITTAPSMHQVRDLLWKAIRINRMNALRPLPGRMLESPPQIKIENKPDLFALGFATDKPERAQGPHLDNLLIIVDEAAGVEDWLWTAIKGWMTNAGCRLLCIGNPNAVRNAFWKAFHERLAVVKAIHISAFDSPNVKAGKQVFPGLTGLEWVEDREAEWGVDSYEYITKVLGNFPSDGDEKVIPLDWITKAFELGEELAALERESDEEERGRLFRLSKAAMDVARAGKDKNAIVSLRGQRICINKYWKQPDINAGSKEATHWIAEQATKPQHFIVDSNAVGGGTHDNLRAYRRETPELFGKCDVIGLDWGSSPDEPTRYINTLSELYGRLRKAFNPKTPIEDRLGLPTASELAAVGMTKELLMAQLNCRRFWYDEKNRMYVETKKMLKKRRKELGGFDSPDVGDAAAALMFIPKKQRLTLLVA